ncbi:MAG: SLC45 family MFS transporter [Lentisphaerae bacterium]|nr:SLC45 family MFS transporter [Lentisphaerota bacterium]
MNKEKTSSGAIWQCGTLQYTNKTLVYLFIWMLWGDFCYTLMETLIPTLLPLVLKQHNASNLTIGLLIGSVPSALNFVLNPIISTASDRTRSKWGRRRPYLLFSAPFVVMFLILLGWSDVIGSWLYNCAWGPNGDPAGVIIGLIAFFSVGFQLFNMFVISVLYYIFADVVPSGLIGRFLALFRFVGMGAGIVFNRWILPMADRRELIPWIFTVVALIYLFGFGTMCIKVKEGQYPPPEKTASSGHWAMVGKYFRECFSIPYYLILFVALAINTTSNSCRIMFNLLFAQHDLNLTAGEFGKIMAETSLVMMFAYIPLGYLVDKFHPLRVFIAGGFLIVLANVFGFFWCYDYKSFYVVSFAISATYILQNASNLPMTIKLYPAEKYGQFCSAAAMISAVTMILANAGGGAFIDHFGYRYIFVWDFFFTIIANVLLIVVYCRWKRYGGDKNYVPPQKKPEKT